MSTQPDLPMTARELRESEAFAMVSEDPEASSPPDSPLTAAEALEWALYARLSTPELGVGDPADEIALPALNGEGVLGDDTVRLSSFFGVKPVALVFGSYTCPPFRGEIRALEDLRRRYGDRVEFLVIYIREAHPEEGWVFNTNREAGIVIHDPVSQEQRASVAARARELGIRMPVLIDDIDDRVASTYGAWPVRLYLVGKDGRIAFQGVFGPFGFEASQLEAAIQGELGDLQG